MERDLSALRRDYELSGLAESDLTDDPMELFGRWFDQAREAGLTEPNAMVLATVDPSGAPSARTVLLKRADDRGFWFYTNLQSRKGADLANEARCALTFCWWELQRQVRVEGVALRVSDDDASAYFATRPRASQLGAWASAQSRPVADRDALDRGYEQAEKEFAGGEVPRPPFWGGYAVAPVRIEFWQGRHGRMHDRLVYARNTPEGGPGGGLVGGPGGGPGEGPGEGPGGEQNRERGEWSTRRLAP